MIKFQVYGKPEPQGSTRSYPVRKNGQLTGKYNTVGDNPKTKSWRQAIVDQVRTLYPAGVDLTTGGPILGPVAVTLIFAMPRPPSHYGTGRNESQVRRGAPHWPDVKPDIDKLARAVLDALTAAGVWGDDAQVVSLTTTKIYQSSDRQPGVLIEIHDGLPEQGA